jgi:hypothetical protein
MFASPAGCCDMIIIPAIWCITVIGYNGRCLRITEPESDVRDNYYVYDARSVILQGNLREIDWLDNTSALCSMLMLYNAECHRKVIYMTWMAFTFAFAYLWYRLTLEIINWLLLVLGLSNDWWSCFTEKKFMMKYLLAIFLLIPRDLFGYFHNFRQGFIWLKILPL